MAEDSIKVELGGVLEGYHLLLDPDELTFGLLEDIASGQIGLILTTLATVIVGGDLPKGTDRAGLRRLKVDEAKSVIEGVGSALDISKRVEKPVHEMGGRSSNGRGATPRETIPTRDDLPDVPRVQARGTDDDAGEGSAPRSRIALYRASGSD